MSDWHDMDNNLAFEPKMTWDKLIEEASKLGYFIVEDKNCDGFTFLNKNGLNFYKNGNVEFITTDFTYDQMFNIMKSLEKKDD